MDNYRIFATGEFLEKLEKLAPSIKRVIEAKLKNSVYPHLKEQPHLGPHIRKLQGYQPDTWRWRIGQFRLFYTIDEQEHIVCITTIDNRKDAY